MWDSRMTERPANLPNFFLRQALISGNRSPVLMGDGVDLKDFHEVAGAAVAAQGNGWTPVTVSEEQVKEVPWAAQYLQCSRGATANCKGHEYTAGCWVEREVRSLKYMCMLVIINVYRCYVLVSVGHFINSFSFHH